MSSVTGTEGKTLASFSALLVDEQSRFVGPDKTGCRLLIGRACCFSSFSEGLRQELRAVCDLTRGKETRQVSNPLRSDPGQSRETLLLEQDWLLRTSEAIERLRLAASSQSLSRDS